jgi:hypothetical protein
MTLPHEFCWTRIGIEAGQPLRSIFHRKDQERAANNGLFFWGIGNAIGPSVAELVRCSRQPEVIFSPIKSAPRRADVNPESVVAWTQAESFEGRAYPLPRQALITSRLNLENPKRAHYALVCRATAPLVPANFGTVDIGSLGNLLTGRPVGASQVTAVVRHSRSGAPVRTYSTVLRARLVAPFLLRLHSPVRLSPQNPAEQWDRLVNDFWAETLSFSGA